ncbi:sugar ABC transporter ATP-binding protein [Propionimicrobium sp. PCR01-08-3]|uniref:sugar ABC transporter ATP-binding protein n=1 Tax=Propionimicrobium sp. PCR01-08-3 TaxID=3052086 RepID=UPI00255D0367|nr:sugar ABC transporter ATP-binding protein [Propionimicrobium sp. PCR01-08-3]WIY83491.1 sugar ABC transporter ATP-binding protein [Propionimicrobium sp. PCR01-08-3]
MRLGQDALLAVTDVTKSFGPVDVLQGVTFQTGRGEVLAIVGENGAGKSTLIKIISGAYKDFGGSINLDGHPVSFNAPSQAIQAGIQVIYQEFANNLFPQMSVAENLFMLDSQKEFGSAWVDKAAMNRAAQEILSTLGISLEPSATVGKLPPASQQMLAIAKASREGAKLLILDEPTAALDDQEVQQLFAQVRRLRDQGVGVIYITHRLNELFALCDRVLVLRNGEVELESRVDSISEAEVVSAMVGRPLDDLYPRREKAPTDLVLRVKNLSGATFTDISFELHRGEVLGIGGPLGCGKGDLLRSLFGLLPRRRGDVWLSGEPFPSSSPRDSISRGLSYLAPDRGYEGLCLQQPVSHNISLASLRRFSQAGFVKRGDERMEIARLINAMRIRAAGPEAEVGTLSGGNQQKVMFGKWILTAPTVLLMEEPTRGVDVGSKADIYRIINDMAASGVAVVLVSSDLPELVEMSDRVFVMREGATVAELQGDGLTQEAVLSHSLRSTEQ